MSQEWPASGRENDGLGRDMELAEILTAIDPASRDPNYWLRFRSWVMAAAAPELGRRRLMRELTVGDLLASWARGVVPAAMAAAVIAALVLSRPSVAPTPTAVGVEELLIAGMEEEPIPATLSAGEGPSFVAFATETF